MKKPFHEDENKAFHLPTLCSIGHLLCQLDIVQFSELKETRNRELMEGHMYLSVLELIEDLEQPTLEDVALNHYVDSLTLAHQAKVLAAKADTVQQYRVRQSLFSFLSAYDLGQYGTDHRGRPLPDHHRAVKLSQTTLGLKLHPYLCHL